MMLSTRASRSPWVLASLMTLAMGMPMMVFYAIGVLGPQIIQDLGISREQLGWLTTSTFGLAALLSPWAGALVQRMGNRQGLFLLFLLVAMSFSLIAVLPGFWGVLTALLLCGLAQSLANPVTNQAIAQLVPAERKAGLVGIKQSGVQASALLAGLALPTLAYKLGWRGAFVVWVPAMLCLSYFALQLLPARASTAAGSMSWRLPWPSQQLWLLMAIQLCAGLVLSSFITFLGVFAQQLGVSPYWIGMLVSGFGVMGIVSRVLLTPIAARFGDETLLLGILFVIPIVALLLMMMAAPDRLWPLGAGVLAIGLTLVATNAIAMSMLLRDARFGAPARTAGLLSVGFFGGFAFGPPLFGVLLRSPEGFAAAWPFLMGILVCASLLCLILYQVRRMAKGE